MFTRPNRIIKGPLSARERTLRKLQSGVPSMIEIIGGDGLSISDFVMNDEKPGLSTLEYHCTVCGGHVLVHHVQVEGRVACPCGPMVGKLL